MVFATWRPLRVMVGAYLFGGCMIAQMFVQGSGVRLNVPAQWLSALPYLATIVVLVLISHNRSTIRLQLPRVSGPAVPSGRLIPARSAAPAAPVFRGRSSHSIPIRR